MSVEIFRGNHLSVSLNGRMLPSVLLSFPVSSFRLVWHIHAPKAARMEGKMNRLMPTTVLSHKTVHIARYRPAFRRLIRVFAASIFCVAFT